MEKLLIMQEAEFQVLAALLGIKDIYGLRPGKEMDEADTMYTVHEMAKKGILVEDEKGLRIEESYRSIMASIKEAGLILAVTRAEEQAANVCFYLGEHIVSLEDSVQDGSAFRLGIFEEGSFYAQLEDRGLLPQPFWDADIAQLQTDEMQESEKKVYAEYRLISPFDAGREPYKSFLLMKSEYGYQIAEESREGARLLSYDAHRFYHMLMENRRF